MFFLFLFWVDSNPAWPILLRWRRSKDATDSDDNEYDGTVILESEVGFGTGPVEAEIDGELGADWGSARHSFNHSVNNDDLGVGFVLSDLGVGDLLHVRTGVDKNYGSFIFEATDGSKCKCLSKDGTIAREKQGVALVFV